MASRTHTRRNVPAAWRGVPTHVLDRVSQWNHGFKGRRVRKWVEPGVDPPCHMAWSHNGLLAVTYSRDSDGDQVVRSVKVHDPAQPDQEPVLVYQDKVRYDQGIVFVAWDQVDDEPYVIVYYLDTIHVRTKTGSMVRFYRFRDGSGNLLVSNGRVIVPYWRGTSRCVNVYRAYSGNLVHTYEILTMYSWAAYVEPYLFLMERRLQVYGYCPGGLPVTLRFPGAAHPDGMTVTPEGELIAVSRRNEMFWLYVFDWTGRLIRCRQYDDFNVNVYPGLVLANGVFRLGVMEYYTRAMYEFQ